MKKLLVASTALVAVAAVSSAQAADPIKLSLGGYMEQWVGYADNEEDNNAANYADVLVQSDSEIYFTGSTKLDNGLTVGVAVQMETDRSDSANERTIDDSILYVSSDNLGKVTLGATKGASYGGNGGVDVGIGLNDGDVGNWINNGASSVDLDTNAYNGQDGQTVRYDSPSLGGATIALSYGTNVSTAPTGELNQQADGTDTRWDAALRYSGEFGGVAVKADVARNVINTGGDGGINHGFNSNGTRYGLNVGVAGFTVGGSYRVSNDIGNSTTKDLDEKVWEVGVSYATGPYAVSLGYITGERDETANDATPDKANAWMLSGAYDLGAGVKLKGSVFSAEFDDGSTTATNSTNDQDGFGVVAGLTVAF